MASYRIISSDSHVFEPADLWTSQAEPRFGDRAPLIVNLEDRDSWFCEGRKVCDLNLATQPGVRFEAPETLSREHRLEEVLPGGYIPEEHIRDMGIDGVDAEVLFPTIGFMMYNVVMDSELLSSLFRTYNDWLTEFCDVSPDRLKGIALLNVDDPRSAVLELERTAKLGLAEGLIPASPPERSRYSLLEYEPLWAAAQDLGVPLHLHVSTYRPGPRQEFQEIDNSSEAFSVNQDHWVRMSLADIIFSGVFERHPDLQIGAVEFEASWVPHFLQRMNYHYTQTAQRETWHRFKEDMLPGDYFHRNVFVGFQEDALGIRLRDIIGVDNLLWGSDYPHQESTFPRSLKVLEEILVDCSDEEKFKIAGGNAARIYHFS